MEITSNEKEQHIIKVVLVLVMSFAYGIFHVVDLCAAKYGNMALILYHFCKYNVIMTKE